MKPLAPHVAAMVERIAGLTHFLDKGNPVDAPLHDRVMLYLVTQNPDALPASLRSRIDPDHLNAVLSGEQREVVKHVRRRRNPGGRPRTLAELLRTNSLVVRLSDHEAAEIRRRAETCIRRVRRSCAAQRWVSCLCVCPRSTSTRPGNLPGRR
ncbi:hypothetical protein ACNHE5_19860 [Pandoraea pnomenusa]